MPNKYKSGFRIFLRCQTASFGAISLGYTLSSMCISMSIIQTLYSFKIYNDDGSQTEYSRYMSIFDGPILCISGFLTSYFVPLLTPVLERRVQMIIADLFFIIGTILTQITYWEVFMIARLMMGITCGINLNAIPLYIREISPDNLSGNTGSIMQANVSLGLILGFAMTLFDENITGNWQPVDNSWRIAFIFPVIFSFIRISCLLLIYKNDTPYFYYSKQLLKEGREALEEIYHPQFIDELEKALTSAGSIDFPTEEEQRKLHKKSVQEGELMRTNNKYSSKDEISKSEIDETMDKCDPLLNLKDDYAQIDHDHQISYRRRLTIGIAVNFFQQMTGLTGLIASSPTMLSLISSDYEVQRSLMIVNSLFLFFVSMLGVTFNFELKRKRYFVGGFLICTILQLALAIIAFNKDTLKESISLQYTFMGTLFSFFAAYNFTLGPITSILTADILKDRGMSISVASNWIGMFISIVIEIMDIDFYINCLCYAGFAFLGFLFSAVYIIETYWLTFPDIVALYGIKEKKTAKQLLNPEIIEIQQRNSVSSQNSNQVPRLFSKSRNPSTSSKNQFIRPYSNPIQN